jgi:hypothetical protein
MLGKEVAYGLIVHFKKQFMEWEKQAKQWVLENYESGSRKPLVVEHGGKKIKLGSITVTEPKMKWEIRDEEVLDRYIQEKENVPLVLTCTVKLEDPSEDATVEALKSLRSQFPDGSIFVKAEQTVTPQMRANYLAACEEFGEPVDMDGEHIPGVHLVEASNPYPRFTAAKDLNEIIAALASDGVNVLDVVKEIEQ